MKNTLRKKKPASAETIARMADHGLDVSRFFTDSGRMMKPVQRVNVDFTASMLEELESAAKELNISRQAVIKTLIRQGLDGLKLFFSYDWQQLRQAEERVFLPSQLSTFDCKLSGSHESQVTSHESPVTDVHSPVPSLAKQGGNLYSLSFMPDLSPELLAFGFIWYIAFLFSTTCHEAAHALVAKIGGDPTAAKGGQVSLNPVPHIQREPWGMVVIPLISFAISRGQSMFGWASAPYDPLWERRHPHRAAWMALAGPAANYSLMLLAVVGLRVGTAMHWLGRDPNTGRADFPTVILFVFFSLNLLLGTFNLLPVPPLDGSTAIILFMSENRAHKYLDWLRGSSYAMLGLLVGWLVFRNFYQYVEYFASNLLLRGHF
jgi:Zn-dependent protease